MRSAPALNIPADPARAARGMEHYGENCLPCHGAPGLKAMEMAEVPFDHKTEYRLVIKSVSAKQRPRRPKAGSRV